MLHSRQKMRCYHRDAHRTDQERNGQKNQAVLHGICNQNEYAEDSHNSADWPEEECGKENQPSTDKGEQVNDQNDRNG